MEQGTWKIETFGKQKGIRLKDFKRKSECKRKGAAFGVGITDNDFISDFSAKKNGAIIIPTANMPADGLILLYLEGDFFVLKIDELADYIVKFSAWSISAAVAGKIRKKKMFYTE